MKLYAGQLRSALDADIAERETRLGMLHTKVAAATQLADGPRVADRGLRSGDYRDDAQMRLAEARASWCWSAWPWSRSSGGVRRRSGVFILADGSSPNWAYEHRQDAKTEVKRARLAAEEAASAEREAEQALAACAPTWPAGPGDGEGAARRHHPQPDVGAGSRWCGAHRRQVDRLQRALHRCPVRMPRCRSFRSAARPT